MGSIPGLGLLPEKRMATYSSILAWEIPWTEEPGRLQSQFSLVTQSCLTLCDPMDCSTPGFPVHHQLPELAQTHVHRVGVAIQLSHPLLSPSPPAFNLSQHQSLFQRIQWPKYWSFSFSINPSNEYSGLISFRMDWLDLLAVQGTLRVFSNMTAQKHQFFNAQPSLWSNSHIRT